MSEEFESKTLNDIIGKERRFHYLNDLLQEPFRLATFLYFEKKSTVNVMNLAKSGYYFNRRDGTVICYSCNNIVNEDNNWEDKTHQYNEKCDMSVFPLCGNAPLYFEDNLDKSDSFPKIFNMLSEIKLCRLSRNIPDPNNYIYFNLDHIQVTERSNFENYNERLETFNWFINLPEDEKPSKEDFANAGFVYTGFSDFVMCFKCKGGLFNILKTDDPVEDHMYFFGHCKFIKNYCAEKNINHTDNTTRVTMFLMERDENLLMTHPMVQNLIFQGLDAEIIRDYISKFVLQFGCFPYNMQRFKGQVEKFASRIKIKNK